MKVGRGRLLLVVILCCALTAGCVNAKAEAETEVSAKPGERPLQIGLSIDSFVIERWIRDRDVFVSAAKELGQRLMCKMPMGM